MREIVCMYTARNSQDLNTWHSHICLHSSAMQDHVCYVCMSFYSAQPTFRSFGARANTAELGSGTVGSS